MKGHAHRPLIVRMRTQVWCPEAMRCHESSHGSGPLTLLALPAELLHRALGAVGPSDLLAAGASCTALHAIAGDGHLWREQLHTRYGSLLEAVFDGVCPAPPPSTMLPASASASATASAAASADTAALPLDARRVAAPSPWRAHFFAFAGTWMLHARAAGRVILLLDGEAFDLTDFVEAHPGGAELLRAAAATDASLAFAAAEHTPNARRILRRYALEGLPPECLRAANTGAPAPWSVSAALRALLRLRHAAGRERLRERWWSVTSAVLHDLTEGRPDGRRLSPAIWRLAVADYLDDATGEYQVTSLQYGCS